MKLCHLSMRVVPSFQSLFAHWYHQRKIFNFQNFKRYQCIWKGVSKNRKQKKQNKTKLSLPGTKKYLTAQMLVFQMLGNLSLFISPCLVGFCLSLLHEWLTSKLFSSDNLLSNHVGPRKYSLIQQCSPAGLDSILVLNTAVREVFKNL